MKKLIITAGLLLVTSLLLLFAWDTAYPWCHPCSDFKIYTEHEWVSCDENRIVVDLYKGILAFSNNGEPYTTSYQCVEYVRRFYDLRRYHEGSDVCGEAWSGNAITWADPVKAERMGLKYYENGSTEPPKPGDIVVFKYPSTGHVALVKRLIRDNQGNLKKIVLIEQNWTNTPSRKVKVRERDGKFFLDDALCALCWLRSKATCPEEPDAYEARRDIPIIFFGLPDDIPLAGDWNGNGKDTIGVYSPSISTFFLDYDNDGKADGNPIQFGVFGDIPIVGDWDGDGKDEIGIYRSADPDKNFANDSTFFLDFNNDGIADKKVEFGMFGDIPVIGDWNKDGRDEIGVFRPRDPNTGYSTFFLDYDNDGNADEKVEFGMVEDIPISGDWNGDGKDTIGVYRECNAVFYLNNLDSKEPLKVRYGLDHEVPVVGDWDGDGLDTIGIFRPDPENETLASFHLTNYTPLSVSPYPDLKVNGLDGPITLNQSDTITITVALNNNGITDNADWWLAADTPFGFYFYTFSGWVPYTEPAYQGPLFYLDNYEVLSRPVLGLEEGTYTLYFGVDTDMDEDITWDSAYYDTVEVTVTD